MKAVAWMDGESVSTADLADRESEEWISSSEVHLRVAGSPQDRGCQSSGSPGWQGQTFIGRQCAHVQKDSCSQLSLAPRPHAQMVSLSGISLRSRLP